VNLTGEFHVDASPQSVWSVLIDPDILCRLSSTCREARQIDETHYEGIIETRVALVRVTAQILGEVLDATEPTVLRVAFQGRTHGLAGSLHGTAFLRLEAGSAGTVGRYTLNMSVLGRLGALGQPLLQKTAQRLAHGFAERVSVFARENAKQGPTST